MSSFARTRDSRLDSPQQADPFVVHGAADGTERFRIAYDPATRLIRAYATGCWSIDETSRCIAGLTRHVQNQRAVCGAARVLLDRRDVPVQPPEVEDILAQAHNAIFLPDDKIALVVGSSVAKSALRQRMPHPNSKAFLSIEAAAMWLGAHVCVPRRAGGF